MSWRLSPPLPEADMSDDPDRSEVPAGAAVFPLIPTELGVNPLLLAVIHATVFLSGSSEAIIHPAAADEALDRLSDYMARLGGTQLQQVREDMDALTWFARQEKWPRAMVHVLTSLLEAIGVGGTEEA